MCSLTGLTVDTRPALFHFPDFWRGGGPDPVPRRETMRRLLWIVAALVLTAGVIGCGSEKERGQYRNQDKPVAADAKDRDQDKDKDK